MVSLGLSCQTTHQLRRLVSSEQDTEFCPELLAPSGPFDWLICPPASTIDLLKKRIPKFSKNSIQLRNGRPYWGEFNIYFWHNFLVTDQSGRYVDIEATFEKELERWSYLSDQFAALDPAETMFVISNTQNNLETEVFDESEHDQYHFTGAEPGALSRSLAEYFHTEEDKIHLEIVTRQDRSSGLNPGKTVSFLPLDQNEWKGSKQSWNQWWQQLDKTR